jgi:hypothetical protein
MEANTAHEDKGTNETTWWNNQGETIGIALKKEEWGVEKRKDLIGEKTSMGYEPKITILFF